jgi:hypothetical protein
MTKSDIQLPVLSSNAFFESVEEIASNLNIDYMEAVIHFCERNNIEIETAAAMIKQNSRAKARLQVNAENLNFLPKTAKLPI